MADKLTPWLPGTVKPVRVGVYQRDLDNVVLYGRWDGRCWFWSCNTAAQAQRAVSQSGWQTDARWRGLAGDPEAK